jgi:hypothetical protein
MVSETRKEKQMKLTGKAYKVIYVMKDGTRINNPSIRYPMELNERLTWRLYPGGYYRATISIDRPLEEAKYGIHWFGNKEDAERVFECFPSTLKTKNVESIELWECIPSISTLIWVMGAYVRGCSHRLTLMKKLKVGIIGKDGYVTWKGVKK